MNYKRIILLAMLLAAVACYYHLFESGVVKEKGDEKEDLTMVLDFKESDVEEIKLIKEDETILLKKEKGIWSIVEPIRGEADGQAVSSYLESLSNVVEVRPIEENPTDMSIFGLESPVLEVVLKQKNDSGSIGLLLGYNNPNYTCVYARLEDSPKIFLIGSLYKMELDRGIEYFETKKHAGPWL